MANRDLRGACFGTKGRTKLWFLHPGAAFWPSMCRVNRFDPKSRGCGLYLVLETDSGQCFAPQTFVAVTTFEILNVHICCLDGTYLTPKGIKYPLRVYPGCDFNILRKPIVKEPEVAHG